MPVSSFTPAAVSWGSTPSVVPVAAKKKRSLSRSIHKGNSMLRKQTKARAATRHARAKLARQVEAALLAAELPGDSFNTAAAAVLAVLLPEEHTVAKVAPTPTTSAPGSFDRADDMSARRVAGQEIFTRSDADPIRDDRLGLAGTVRRNGSTTGPQITGWR